MSQNEIKSQSDIDECVKLLSKRMSAINNLIDKIDKGELTIMQALLMATYLGESKFE